MAIENTKDEAAALQVSSEHLLTGLFTPGEKQSFAPVENVSPHELLAKNELLIQEVNAQAARIAAAALVTLSGMPSAYQDTFFQGVSCFAGPHDVVFNSMREQWAAGDVKRV